MKNEKWANEREIKKVLTEKACPLVGDSIGGPVLYHASQQSWIYGGEGHFMNFGVSGAGKSRRCSIPTTRMLIESGESFAVVDPKGEIYNQTACYLGDTYEWYVLNFRDMAASMCWNPLMEPYRLYTSQDPSEREQACQMIDDLAASLYPIVGNNDPFWPCQARDLFAGACYLLFENARPEEVHIASVFHMISQGEETLGQGTYLKLLIDELPRDSIGGMMLKSYVTTANDTKGGIRSTFFMGISKFVRSAEMLKTLGNDQINIYGHTGQKPVAIYVILPDETPVFNELAGVFMSQITLHYIHLAQKNFNGRLPVRFNVILEELGNIGKAVPNLAYLMSASRSRNIRCHLFLQNMSQLSDIYGEEGAQTITSNADIILAFRTTHWGTLEELSKKCGQRSVCQDGSFHTEPLITPTQLGAMKTGQGLVMISGRTKYIVNLPDYSEMFDLSNWRMPVPLVRKNMQTPGVFDIRAFVKEMKRKKLLAMMNTPPDDQAKKPIFRLILTGINSEEALRKITIVIRCELEAEFKNVSDSELHHQLFRAKCGISMPLLKTSDERRARILKIHLEKAGGQVNLMNVHED